METGCRHDRRPSPLESANESPSRRPEPARGRLEADALSTAAAPSLTRRPRPAAWVGGAGRQGHGPIVRGSRLDRLRLAKRNPSRPDSDDRMSAAARHRPDRNRRHTGPRKTIGGRLANGVLWFTARDQFTARGQEPESNASADDRPASSTRYPRIGEIGAGEDKPWQIRRPGVFRLRTPTRLGAAGLGHRQPFCPRHSGGYPPHGRTAPIPPARGSAPETRMQLTPIERARADLLLDAFSPGRPKAGITVDFSAAAPRSARSSPRSRNWGRASCSMANGGWAKTTPRQHPVGDREPTRAMSSPGAPCDSETTYDSLMRSLLRGLSIRFRVA